MKYTLICSYDNQDVKRFTFTANNRKEADDVASHLIFDIAFNDDISYVAFYAENELLYTMDYSELLWCLI